MSATAATPTAAALAPVLELAAVSKSYPGVRALRDVSLSLAGGTVLALLGENGAGKSTLIKIISGVERPDAGAYRLLGRPADIRSPRQAMKAGIGVVHQERSLVPTFTVGENVLLDRVIGDGRRLVNRRRIHADAERYMEQVGLTVSPTRGVASLSAAQQQLIEIARALSTDARILLLDEPTASISLKEASALLATIRALRDRGTSIIYVSHKLEEVFEVCDAVTVLRDGRNAGPQVPLAGLERDRLIAMMIGRSEVAAALPARPEAVREPVLEVSGQSSEATARTSAFTLHRGEILGWYGLVGAGRTELARAVIGIDHVAGGSVRLRGRSVRIRSLSEALRRHRIGYVSENRQVEGLFLIHSIQRNIAASVWQRLRRRSRLLFAADERRLAEDYRKALDIRTPGVAQPVGSLSGGNRQKVSLSKWLAAAPEILFIDEPTVGIDIRTKSEIHHLIHRLAEGGMSVVLISSDLPEMIRLADRILVFRGGAVAGALPNSRSYDEMSRKVMSIIVGGAAAAA
jgi:ribose transport system ATP-binding protein